MHDFEKKTISRRDFFHAVGLTGLAAIAATGGLVVPGNASASELDAMIAAEIGEGNITMDKITMDIPVKAENGALVRLPVEIDHPQTDADFIQTVVIFVDNNPKPFAARFDLTAEAAPQFEVRVKMAKASNVRIIAKTNGGALFGLVKEVQVAEGGCAG